VRLGCSSVRAAGYSLQPRHHSSLTAPNLQHTANQERNNQCGNQHHSRELLMMGRVVPETCWAYKQHNKIISGICWFFILQLPQWCTVHQTSNLTIILRSRRIVALSWIRKWKCRILFYRCRLTCYNDSADFGKLLNIRVFLTYSGNS